MRQWRGQCLATGRTIELPTAEQLPFSVKPNHKLTVRDVITILRYHGRGTICGSHTQEAAVFQLRSWLPPEIGCVYWRTSGEPCCSVLIPWYLGSSVMAGLFGLVVSSFVFRIPFTTEATGAWGEATGMMRALTSQPTASLPLLKR